MEIVKLPRKEFKKRFGKGSRGMYVSEDEEIFVPFGVSSRTLLHEIAHSKLGHKGPLKDYDEYAQREIQADKWAYETLGKEMTINELFLDFGSEIDKLIKEGNSANQIFTWLKNAAEGEGYVLDREDKSALWWWIRDRYKELKAK